jgi:hypothetical protein
MDVGFGTPNEEDENESPPALPSGPEIAASAVMVNSSKL